MTSANLDLVRWLYAAWKRVDFGSTEWADAEIEYGIADGPSPGTRAGVAGMAEVTREWMSVWQEWRTAADEFRELDDERVLVLVHYSGRGRTSGLEIGQIRSEGAALYHLRDGRVTRLIFYLDRERALADLGLAREARPQ